MEFEWYNKKGRYGYYMAIVNHPQFGMLIWDKNFHMYMDEHTVCLVADVAIT